MGNMNQKNNAQRVTELLQNAGLFPKKAAEETKVVGSPDEAMGQYGKDQTQAGADGLTNATGIADAAPNMAGMPAQPANQLPAGGTDDPAGTIGVGMDIVENTKTAGQVKLAALRAKLTKRAEDGGAVPTAENAGEVPPAGVSGTLNEDTARAEGPSEDFPAGTQETTMDIPKTAAALSGLFVAAHHSNNAKSELFQLNKSAAAAQTLPYPTAVQCLTKIASIRNDRDANEFTAMLGAIQKNPAFQLSLTKVAMRKKAEDVEAVAAANGVPPEEAAAMLDEAVGSDPALQQQLTEELNGEALQDLAESEIDGASLEQAAADVGVAPEEIQAVAEQIAEMADEAGVAPEEMAAQIASELDEALADGGEETAEIPAEAETKTASQKAIARARAIAYARGR